ncbi:hypothetical protein HMN09_00301800 [Mycena chlorophos]|uniref:Uncharacterized protein n=1 Tax=Mycena chlorophos TaxID=658473 RepID=A0A8H6WPB8_MYCCL|nr:hypothetical protein HMN09_00301800 [Mycena chlorophos]
MAYHDPGPVVAGADTAEAEVGLLARGAPAEFEAAGRWEDGTWCKRRMGQRWDTTGLCICKRPSDYRTPQFNILNTLAVAPSLAWLQVEDVSQWRLGLDRRENSTTSLAFD